MGPLTRILITSNQPKPPYSMRPFNRSGNQCDCCSEPFIDTLYACRNFTYQGFWVFARAVGRWAVCYSCRQLLEQGKTSKLARRAKKDVSLFEALLSNIIPGYSWKVYQVRGGRPVMRALERLLASQKPKDAQGPIQRLFASD